MPSVGIEMANDEQGRVYAIRVRGHVNPVWATRFPGFSISHDSDGNTVFSGRVVDQAGLFGLISRVRDSGMALISVEPAEPGAGAHERLTE